MNIDLLFFWSIDEYFGRKDLLLLMSILAGKCEMAEERKRDERKRSVREVK